MVLYRHDLIYPFRTWADARTVTGLPRAAAHTLIADDGTEVAYWQAPALGGKPTILYFKGNAGSLASSGPRLAEFALRGYGILALNYRGAGGMPGRPDQERLIADALALYDKAEVLPVVWGTSLGAALAVQVASRRQAAAVILETPFASLCETAQHHYPLIPACLVLPDNRWDSAALIGRITAPLLILHGDADQVVPLTHGQSLYRRAPAPKKMIVYPGGRHNDLRLHGAGADILAFLATLTAR